VRLGIPFKKTMHCKRLVFIDNHESRRHLIVALREAGFKVIESLESEDGVRHVVEDAPHSIFMSEAMPPISDGTELLPVLRCLTTSPIVVLGSGDETAVVWAFLEGADAYLVREVSIRELLARLNALLRRHDGGHDFDGEHYSSFPDKSHLDQLFSRLSQTEARLLRYLLAQRGRLVDQEELLEQVWGRRGKNTLLRFYIRQLRLKLANWAQQPSIEILTRKGKGYRLLIDSMAIYP
jgi:DNA-binding response OmpR family regulator